MTQEHETLMTPNEVANLIRVNPHTLKRWRLDKEGPPYVAVSDRTIRYRKSDVEDWLDENWRIVDEARTDEFD